MGILDFFKKRGRGEEQEIRARQARGNEQEKSMQRFSEDFENYERTRARTKSDERFFVEVNIGEGQAMWEKNYSRPPERLELPTPMDLGLGPGVYPVNVRLIDLAGEQEYLGETKLTVLGPKGDRVIRLLYPQERDYSNQKGIPFMADVAAPTPYKWVLTINGEPIAHDEREMRNNIGFSIPIRLAEEALRKSKDGRTHALLLIITDINNKEMGNISRKFFYKISGT